MSEPGKRLSIFLKYCTCVNKNSESLVSFHGLGEGSAGIGKGGIGRVGKVRPPGMPGRFWKTRGWGCCCLWVVCTWTERAFLVVRVLAQ